jgi:hypothetical protein
MARGGYRCVRGSTGELLQTFRDSSPMRSSTELVGAQTTGAHSAPGDGSSPAPGCMAMPGIGSLPLGAAHHRHRTRRFVCRWVAPAPVEEPRSLEGAVGQRDEDDEDDEVAEEPSREADAVGAE